MYVIELKKYFIAESMLTVVWYCRVAAKLQLVKNSVSVKHNEVKCHKMRYAGNKRVNVWISVWTGPFLLLLPFSSSSKGFKGCASSSLGQTAVLCLQSNTGSRCYWRPVQTQTEPRSSASSPSSTSYYQQALAQDPLVWVVLRTKPHPGGTVQLVHDGCYCHVEAHSDTCPGSIMSQAWSGSGFWGLRCGARPVVVSDIQGSFSKSVRPWPGVSFSVSPCSWASMDWSSRTPQRVALPASRVPCALNEEGWVGSPLGIYQHKPSGRCMHSPKARTPCLSSERCVRGLWAVMGLGFLNHCPQQGLGLEPDWVPVFTSRSPFLTVSRALLCRQSSHRWGWWCQQRAGCAGEDPGGSLPGAALHGPHLPGPSRGGWGQAGAGSPFEVSGATCGLNQAKLMWYQPTQNDSIKGISPVCILHSKSIWGVHPKRRGKFPCCCFDKGHTVPKNWRFTSKTVVFIGLRHSDHVPVNSVTLVWGTVDSLPCLKTWGDSWVKIVQRGWGMCLG